MSSSLTPPRSPMRMRKVRLACVPEQVNLPIQIAKERQLFAQHGVDLELVYVPEGTGRMIDMLEKQEVDLACTVCDAFIVARSKGRAVQLSGVWVPSPLTWAIAASPKLSADTTVKDLFKRQGKLRVGISRVGSGSHTMASYMAMLHGISSEGLEFVVANDFRGLRDGIANDRFDVFLWETFTTKPCFDSGELMKIGEVQTPWPAFCFVTRSTGMLGEGKLTDIEQQLSHDIRYRLFPALKEAAEDFVKCPDESVDRIVNDMGHKKLDASMWLEKCRYSEDDGMAVDREVLQNSISILRSIGLVPTAFQIENLFDHSNQIISVV